MIYISNQLKETEQSRDGGYYAIKGFIYQFDLTLKEILSNIGKPINFENLQDIDYENYVIQVKHKETANFSLSKIKPAVIQLFDLSMLNNEKKFKLYCHFKDKIPEENQRLSDKITLKQLDKILGENNYEIEDKNKFINNFEIVFLHNFEESFSHLINLIKKKYGISNTEVALYYHAIFQTELTRLAIKERESRTITSHDLDAIIENNNQIIFYEGYRHHISEEKFIKLIKDKYFTHRKPHIVPHERIFILECETDEIIEELMNIVYHISDKFYRDGSNASKTPAPYICFRCLNKDVLIRLKRTLIDRDFYFNDGTFFNGDKFRSEILLSDKRIECKIKFIDECHLNILENLKSVETYQFFRNTPIDVDYQSKNLKLSVDSLEYVLRIIN